MKRPEPAPSSLNAPNEKPHVCPYWIGFLLASPLRRLLENPQRLVGPLVQPGMQVLDLGSAMGFFSLPVARLVGPAGRVFCVDIQPRMLAKLQRRAEKAGLADRIETAVCASTDLGLAHLEGTLDLALAIYVVHELTDARAILGQIHRLLKPAGQLLIAEPKGHVSAAAFAATGDTTRKLGFAPQPAPPKWRSRVALFQKE